MSDTTSTTTGPDIVSALSIAPPSSDAFVTRKPDAPIDSATCTKFVSRKCHSSACRPCSSPP